MRGKLLFILAVAIAVSTLNVVSMVRNCNNVSFATYAANAECSGQGDFMPEPYDANLFEPTNEHLEQFCITQELQNQLPGKKIKKVGELK